MQMFVISSKDLSVGCLNNWNDQYPIPYSQNLPLLTVHCFYFFLMKYSLSIRTFICDLVSSATSPCFKAPSWKLHPYNFYHKYLQDWPLQLSLYLLTIAPSNWSYVIAHNPVFQKRMLCPSSKDFLLGLHSNTY